jgi:amino acid transporter
MQIIETFPSGGGSYLVASKLLSPTVGMVAGCALLVDYVLTIAVSIASGSDAIFSFLPLGWQNYKMTLTYAILILMVVLNLRGVKESIKPLIPIFLIFIFTHVLVICYAIFPHAGEMGNLVQQTAGDFQLSIGQLGMAGTLFIILHAYSLGGGTYTGIEAVSNGMSFLREPRVKTGKRTMIYMAVSLAFISGGLILGYLLFRVAPHDGKTLNAVLFEMVTQKHAIGGKYFVILALISEAMILFVAAQTGFLGGPTVLANMALDGWMPNRFSVLSDHLVTQNGVLLMGIASVIVLFISNGSVGFLVVLYSINVFLTFTLSQMGMVKHWWEVRHRESKWKRRMAINGIGLLLTTFVLITVIIVKFFDGGWLTLVVTTSIIILSLLIKQHYKKTRQLLTRLDVLLKSALPKKDVFSATDRRATFAQLPADADTAIILVNGFGGLGLHTLFGILRIFHGHFKNFVFMQVGVLDAGGFKGVEEVENLRKNVQNELAKYVDYMHLHGYHAESVYSLGTDVVSEVEKLAEQVAEKYPSSVFFAGQLVFPEETIMTRFLHNYTSFAVQKRLYQTGIPVFILPIRV